MLYGTNVTLRNWSLEDISELQKLRNDLEMQTQLMGTPKPSSSNKVLNWLKNRDRDESIVFFVIALRQSNKAIGYIQLSNIDNFNLFGYLGICLAKEYWGKGYADESLSLLTNYAIDILNLRKILLLVKSDNTRAIGFYKKSRFDEVGLLKKHQLICGTWKDVLMMEKIISK